MKRNVWVIVWACMSCVCGALTAFAQQPYSAQLRTDPSAGNVQGIQRIGRALRTDPDAGGGFSYHVYPTGDSNHSATVGATRQATGDGTVRKTPKSFRSADPKKQTSARRKHPSPAEAMHAWQDPTPKIAAVAFQEAVVPRETGSQAAVPAPLPPVERTPAQTTFEAIAPGEAMETGEAMATGEAVTTGEASVAAEAGSTGEATADGGAVAATPEQFTDGPSANQSMRAGLSPMTFDWTRGIRNVYQTAGPLSPREAFQLGLQSSSLNRTAQGTGLVQIYHQPLIQVRLRVVEVTRSDTVTLGSILEYVSENGLEPSLTSGETANGGAQNTRGVSRFTNPALTSSATAGTGTLINLTTEHINAVIQGLSTELNADVITAPEVVTLNGQNVEFVSGERIPFQLGQNVIQGTNNNVQQVFYKHVGTMVSVTPRIVSWGFHGEGVGRATIQAHHVTDWATLVHNMRLIQQQRSIEFIKPDGNSIASVLEAHRDAKFIPFSAQTEILLALNNYAKGDLAREQLVFDEIGIDISHCENNCKWSPDDCTIDLSLVVRLSDGNPAVVDDPTMMNTLVLSGNASEETNVRAVSNVIQIKSGHGVVMAGLIGERESDNIAKVPLLGDLPFVGTLFRSKEVARNKTEVLIFVEARALDPRPEIARAQSAEDFRLGQAYVEGDLLDNPLEIGMNRTGFGTYLPPYSKHEQVFWEKYHRELRRAYTHTEDIFGP